ncbi:MAG: alpha/beta hydrolase [Ignavibacteriota bacterium]
MSIGTSTLFGQASSVKTARCYDPNDPKDIRLWPSDAPGAVGTDPCADIPFLRMFKPDGAAPTTTIGIIVMPGGGYNQLTDKSEQTPVANHFANKLGITTFILYYRLVQANGTYRYPVPMWDAQRAVRLVRANAAQYAIDPTKIGVFGFSAGGHLASTIAIHSDTSFNLTTQDGIDSTDPRPDFLGLGYPVISMDPNQYASPNSLAHLLSGYTGTELTQLETYLSGQEQVTSTTPPTFLFESWDDMQISSQNSSLFYEALNTAKVPAEGHIFQKGLHGDGLAVGQEEEYIWPSLFRNWLIVRGLLPQRPTRGAETNIR